MNLKFDHNFTLNPDGSGYVRMKWTGTAPEGTNAASFMRDEIRNARGVDAWTEMSCTVEDGLRFEALAFFRNIAALRFHCSGFHFSDLDFACALEDGVFTLRNAVEASDAAGEPPVEGLSDDQLRERLKTEREKFRAMRGLLTGMLGGLRCDVIFQLPGKVIRVRNADKVDDQLVAFERSGDDLLGAIDTVIGDDDLMIKVMRTGQLTPELLETILGEGKGPIEVTMEGPLAPLFDYESEAAEAREAFAETAAAIGAPVQGAPAKGVRVAGVRIVLEDDDQEVRPFNYSKGLTLAIAVVLPGPATGIKEARYDRAILDTGENIAPKSEGERRVSFPKLSSDRSQACLEVRLPLPAPGARGFKEIAGVVTCVVAEGTREVDLGFRKFESGATGTEFGAVIEQIKDGSFDEGQTIAIQLGLPTAAIRSLALRGADGRDLPFSSAGWSSCDDVSTLRYSAESKIPSDGRLVASVYTTTREVEITFALNDVDLLGRPRG